jgi:hypothetical protein
MKMVVSIVGVLLVLLGGIWFLQGINLLPGSFMTGDLRWSLNGGFLILVGAGLLWFANRRKKETKKNE